MVHSILKEFENNKKTLVIEDDSTMRILLEESLSLRGYEVDSFASGEEGWEAFTKNFYQLVILDWKLPDITGIDLCKKIREVDYSSYISIILITGNNTPKHLQTAFDAGADDYITKPFPLSLLNLRLLIAEQRAKHRLERAKAEEALVRAQQLAAVGTLAAGIAHEFNNIHTSVIGYLQLSLNCNIDNEAREYIKRVLGAAKRATGITKNLLAFTRSGIIGKKNSNLNDIINETLSIVSRELNSEGIIVKLELDKNLPEINCDTGQIGQIIMNLLINARHAVYGREEKVVIVKSGQTKDYLFISVKDSGLGIPNDEKEKIFLPFFSTKGEYAKKDSITSDIKGTGLGLSVCNTIAHNHNGRIEFESEIEKGSTFTLFLARTEKEDAEAPVDSNLAQDLTGRILILDDDKDIQLLLATLLRSKGHDIFSTDDGLDAIAEHQKNPFDIALVDLQMPKLNGIEFVKKMEMLKSKPPEIIIITGKSTMFNVEEIKECKSITKIIKKPFDIYNIADSISIILSKRIGSKN